MQMQKCRCRDVGVDVDVDADANEPAQPPAPRGCSVATKCIIVKAVFLGAG